MSVQVRFVMMVVSCIVMTGCAGHRVGQSATVQFGTVRSAEPVTLDSNAAQGALVGGTIGLAVGRGNSSAFNAIRGAAIGGVAKAATEGDRRGIAYTVELSNGSSTRIITDQLQIRPGDCVAVEKAGNTANIRRTSEHYCDPGNSQALHEVERTVQSEAIECERAKDELSRAKGEQATELAIRKTELLCDG